MTEASDPFLQRPKEWDYRLCEKCGLKWATFHAEERLHGRIVGVHLCQTCVTQACPDGDFRMGRVSDFRKKVGLGS